MPFRNLKFLIILVKALGLFSCKLANNRLKSSSAWSYCVCTMWFFLHCLLVGTDNFITYTTYIYKITTKDYAEITTKDYALSILRSIIYFVAMLPYTFVAIFWSENFVKLSNKLLAYDENVIILGHRRKDKHVFTYLFFVYMCIVISCKFYVCIINSTVEGTGILSVLQYIIPTIRDPCCVLITCMFLDLIRQRFRHLNETIVLHISQLPVTGSQGEITVYNVRYLHGVLLDGAKLINTLYGAGTLLTFISILLEVIWSTYKVMKNLEKEIDIFYDLVQLMDMLFQTIYLVVMYHFTTYEANRVENRVIKYSLSFSNNECRMDKVEMMLYFYHMRYCFTAAEFFPLDIAIFLPFTSAVMTYLILIL